jgi:hypothetical protein
VPAYQTNATSTKQKQEPIFDNNITQAKDKRTILAKGNQTNTQCRAIDSAHVKNNKPAIGLAQRGCNTAYSLGTTIDRTLKKISNNKHIRFAKNNKVHLFDNAETPIMMTYDSGANGHYISKKDRRKAGLPIIRKSTRRVGVANGGVSQAKFVTQLPYYRSRTCQPEQCKRTHSRTSHHH